MNFRQQPGPLVMIGGSEDKDGESKVLAEFVRLAGGRQAHIVIIAVASERPLEVVGKYLEVFDWMGVAEARHLEILRREQANDTNAIAAIEQASGVFFTGGNQVRISRVIGGTDMDSALHRRHQAGMTLAGTSAGAAMMSSIMIIGGIPEAKLRPGIVQLAPGMGFIQGVVIDQHFEERGRLRRLLSAIAQYPHNLGIGIDEDTAAVLQGNTLSVIGNGAVTIIDASDLTYSNFPGLDPHELLAMCGVKVHILPPRLAFDMEQRLPIVEGNSYKGGKRKKKTGPRGGRK